MFGMYEEIKALVQWMSFFIILASILLLILVTYLSVKVSEISDNNNDDDNGDGGKRLKGHFATLVYLMWAAIIGAAITFLILKAKTGL